MKLTPAERNHLLHHIKENSDLVRGPAIAWSVENGFMPHEFIPLLGLLSEEMKVDGSTSMEPTEPWAPPCSPEEFRNRITEAKKNI